MPARGRGRIRTQLATVAARRGGASTAVPVRNVTASPPSEEPGTSEDLGLSVSSGDTAGENHKKIDDVPEVRPRTKQTARKSGIPVGLSWAGGRSLEMFDFGNEDSSDSEGSEDDSRNEESTEELSDGAGDDTEVDVTLEFFDPRESDFLGLKALLQNFLDGRDFAASELVDTIIKQSSVGTVVKAGEDEDPIGVLSILSTQRYRQLSCLAEIRRYLLQQCRDEKTQILLEKAWDGASTGLLISERLINCPPQLGPPLLQALFEEIAWATEDEPTQELRKSFQFKQYIAVSRVFAEPIPGKSGKKKKQKVMQEPQLVFVRPEDEFFHKHCTSSFSFAASEGGRKDDLQARRLVLLLDEGQVAKARAELDQVVGNPAAKARG